MEEEITIIRQSSAVMQQTRGKDSCFFPVNKEEEDKEVEESKDEQEVEEERGSKL